MNKPANWKKKKGLWVCTNPKRAFKQENKSSKFVGMLPRRQDIEVLPADESDSKQLGWVIKEAVGVAVVNPHAIVRGEMYHKDCTNCEHWNNKKCKIKQQNCEWEPNETFRIENKGW